MNKQIKMIGTILGVIFFIALIAGLTYAYTVWRSENINKTVSSKCFNVFYDKGEDISGSIFPSSDYSGGLSASVKMNIDESCNINANGVLYLNTLDTTSDILYSNGLLNYQLVVNGEATDKKGSITSSGEITIDLGDLSKDTSANTEYVLYIWTDIEKMDVSSIGASYYGNIRAEAIQYN